MIPYISEFLNSDLHKRFCLPIIAFAKQDAHRFVYELRNEFGYSQIKVEEQKNTIISCKHFPYICSEFEYEHYDHIVGRCNCKNIEYVKYCEDEVPVWRSYINYSDDEYVKKIKSKCDDGCCCKVRAAKRYVIHLNI